MKIRRVWLGSLLLLVLFLVSSRANGSSIHAAVPTPIPILTHGPLVGAVTSNSARVFARTDTDASVQVRYSTSATLQTVQETPPYLTTGESDWTTIIPLPDLLPNTVYYYDILVNQAPSLSLPYPQFKTFPPEGTEVSFKFAILTDFGTFGSDKPPLKKPVRTFREVDEETPDFVIIGGDFFHTYANSLTEKRDLYKHNYELNSPAAPMDDFVTRILPRYPLAHMWDDHDLGKNNANKNYKFIARARQVMQEFFPVYPLGAGGDYQSFTYGDAEFWMLDARSFRDPAGDPDGPNKSMLDGDNLGDAGQLQWLLNGLENSTARWKFIVSPVPFNNSLIKNDSWVGYRHERQKLIDFIDDNHISGVIILSGDLHFGGIDDGENSAFPELLSPGPNLKTCATTHDPGMWSVGAYVTPDESTTPCDGYGMVTVMQNPDRVLLQVKNQKGATKLQYTVQ